jgi:galactokinase
MKKNDVNEIGNLMSKSHKSLKNDYGVSSKELDLMVEIAEKEAGCFGARMTGAGFGGCVISLIDESFKEEFMRNVFNNYFLKTGIKPMIYLSSPSGGVRLC